MTHPMETEETREQRYTLLEALESRSDAAVERLDADWLSRELELLLVALVQKETQQHVAATELRATERLRSLAEKHEDIDVVRGCEAALADFHLLLPLYAEVRERYWVQWGRHWQSLLKYRLPDALHDALGVIAQAEGRTPLEQIMLFLKAAVAEWQAHQRH